MQELSRQNFSDSQSLSALFDWKPDLARFEREVAEAQMKGAGDGLSLAEMECSVDLIEAELLTLRGRSNPGDETRGAIAELTDLRRKLARLIDRMRPLAEY